MLFDDVKAIPTAEVFAAFFPGHELRRDGRVLSTLCIFHQEKTASLKLYKNGFKCYGCGVTGSNIDLLIKANLASSALEAAKLIAQKFGIKFEDKKTGGMYGSKNAGTVERLTALASPTARPCRFRRRPAPGGSPRGAARPRGARAE